MSHWNPHNRWFSWGSHDHLFLTEFICYDDGCHLRKYARHDSRKDVTAVTKQLAEMEIIIDKLHMQGHTDGWCHQNCDPHLFPELNNVSLPVWSLLFIIALVDCHYILWLGWYRGLWAVLFLAVKICKNDKADESHKLCVPPTAPVWPSQQQRGGHPQAKWIYALTICI